MNIIISFLWDLKKNGDLLTVFNSFQTQHKHTGNTCTGGAQLSSCQTDNQFAIDTQAISQLITDDKGTKIDKGKLLTN